jgi:hypothetical protein
MIGRLAQEVIGAGGESLDAIRNGVDCADENHRRQPRRAIALDLPAHVESVQARHRDVEQHDVRRLPTNRLERLRSIARRDHRIPMRGEQPFVHPTDRLVIVGDQNNRGAQACAVRQGSRGGEGACDLLHA